MSETIREILHDGHDGAWPGFGDLYKDIDQDLFLTQERTWNEASAVSGFLQSRGCESLLDLGCGDGRIAHALTEHGMDVVGVDIDGKAIGRALLNFHVRLFLFGHWRRLILHCPARHSQLLS